MARPKKYFSPLEFQAAKKAARERSHKLWKYESKGFLGKGYFAGQKLPTLIKHANVKITPILFSRGKILDAKTGKRTPEKAW